MGMTHGALSFLVEGRWSPSRSGSYEEDCATGRAAAEEALKLIEQEENPALFGTIIRAMVAGGTFDGVEIGFCSVVGIKLIGLM